MQEERGYNITQEFSTEDFVPNYAPWNVPADTNRCSIALIIVFKPPQFLSEHMTLFHSYLGLTVGFLLGSLVLGADVSKGIQITMLKLFELFFYVYLCEKLDIQLRSSVYDDSPL